MIKKWVEYRPAKGAVLYTDPYRIYLRAFEFNEKVSNDKTDFKKETKLVITIRTHFFQKDLGKWKALDKLPEWYIYAQLANKLFSDGVWKYALAKEVGEDEE